MKNFLLVCNCVSLIMCLSGCSHMPDARVDYGEGRIKMEIVNIIKSESYVSNILSVKEELYIREVLISSSVTSNHSSPLYKMQFHEGQVKAVLVRDRGWGGSAVGRDLAPPDADKIVSLLAKYYVKNKKFNITPIVSEDFLLIRLNDASLF